MAVAAGGARRAPPPDQAPFLVDRGIVLAAALHLALNASAPFSGFPVAVDLPRSRSLHGSASFRIAFAGLSDHVRDALSPFFAPAFSSSVIP